jgi:tetratricopeptide (TPR) repeat protein
MVRPGDAQPSGEPSRTSAAWIEAVRAAERRGELLSAFDLAERGLEEYPGDVALQYHAVLSLARTGSTFQAGRRFIQLNLSSVDTEDVAALEARIKKDEALAATGLERKRLAARAATSYRVIRDRTHGYFPAINAATLALVAGDDASARALARDALDLVTASREESYFAFATKAEAYLLVGDEDAAREALERAAAIHAGDYGALSTTRRQLRLICTVTGISPLILSALAGPAVAHFCGHRMAAPGQEGRLSSDQEDDVTFRIADAVERRPVGYAYGSLASGGDILWAEALLARACELHVVLPFALEEFVATSVAPAGGSWVERFERCLAAATSVDYATVDAYLDDDVLYGYCAELAMGLALVRARHLDSDVHQLALWDGEAPAGVAGTAVDVARWKGTGHDVVVVAPPGPIPVPGVVRTGAEDIRTESQATRVQHHPHRVIRAMLIGDISGFSKLADEQLPTFAAVILGTIARVLGDHDAEVEYRNTWGDALYAVVSGAPAAARCALELQNAIGALDLEAVGLPRHLALRLSGHIGPVFPIRDPVLGADSFMGSHVSRTARIEPVTPPGAVYVTEAFASALELSGVADVGCDYVGHLPAAKDFGRLRMYRLRRRDSGVATDP